jgi:hypothetical protein
MKCPKCLVCYRLAGRKLFRHQNDCFMVISGVPYQQEHDDCDRSGSGRRREIGSILDR